MENCSSMLLRLTPQGTNPRQKKASIKVTPVADKTGDALTEFLPDSTGSVDLLNDDLKNKGNGFNGTPA